MLSAVPLTVLAVAKRHEHRVCAVAAVKGDNDAYSIVRPINVESVFPRDTWAETEIPAPGGTIVGSFGHDVVLWSSGPHANEDRYFSPTAISPEAHLLEVWDILTQLSTADFSHYRNAAADDSRCIPDDVEDCPSIAVFRAASCSISYNNDKLRASFISNDSNFNALPVTSKGLEHWQHDLNISDMHDEVMIVVGLSRLFAPRSTPEKKKLLDDGTRYLRKEQGRYHRPLLKTECS